MSEEPRTLRERSIALCAVLPRSRREAEALRQALGAWRVATTSPSDRLDGTLDARRLQHGEIVHRYERHLFVGGQP